MENSLEAWKGLALWAMDVQAATSTREAMMKSASKSSKKRHLAICEKLYSAVGGGSPKNRLHLQTFPELHQARDMDIDHVVKRLEGTIQILKEQVP